MEADAKKAADMLSDLAMKGHPYAQVWWCVGWWCWGLVGMCSV